MQISRPKMTIATLGAVLLAMPLLASTNANPSFAVSDQVERGQSPNGQILVVAANVAEVLDEPDNEKTRDLGNFARIMGQAVPYSPDVILVSEVKLQTAQNLVERLNLYGPTGTYALVAPPAATFPETQGTATTPDKVRNVAIILNTSTMTVTQNEQWIPLAYPKSENTGLHEWSTNYIPFMRVREVNAGGVSQLAAAVVSVHLKPKKALVDPEARHALWLEQIMDKLDESFTNGIPIPVIGGDMNNALCIPDTVAATDPNCVKTPLWSNVSTHVNSVPGSNLQGTYSTVWPIHIDHIFTQGTVLARYRDDAMRSRVGTSEEFDACEAKYKAGTASSLDGVACWENYYSDHPFVWGLLGPRP